MEDLEIIDTGYRGVGLEKELSNLMPYGFRLDDVWCGSIEGFLQSLKFSDPDEQQAVATLHGVEAWKTGQKGNDWKANLVLYWRGQPYKRLLKNYHGLLSRAYDACLEGNPSFANALRRSGNAVLIHSIGKHNPHNTTLTEWEYLFQLYRLRAKVLQGA